MYICQLNIHSVLRSTLSSFLRNYTFIVCVGVGVCGWVIGRHIQSESHRETAKEGQRQTYTETDRRRQTDIQRQTDIKRQIETDTQTNIVRQKQRDRQRDRNSRERKEERKSMEREVEVGIGSCLRYVKRFGGQNLIYQIKRETRVRLLKTCQVS